MAGRVAYIAGWVDRVEGTSALVCFSFWIAGELYELIQYSQLSRFERFVYMVVVLQR